ncbi:MAG: hypothetical protein ACI93R_000143 [Flavobacteriales bacterium]|jgi:hypothetical protein
MRTVSRRLNSRLMKSECFCTGQLHSVSVQIDCDFICLAIQYTSIDLNYNCVKSTGYTIV